MTFKLSQRSKNNLKGVHPKLVRATELALTYSDVDFGVTCGLRTQTEQELLVAAGKSQTMKSKHLRQADGYSHAVDLVAYIGGSVCWELNVYDNLADAMKKAAREVGIGITWGGAWSVEDLTVFSGTAEEAMMQYIDLRRSASKRPFLDGPHFQTCGLI